MLAQTTDRTRPPGTARIATAVLAVAAVGVMGHAVVTGARLEQVLVGLGLAAASALAGLIAAAGGPGVSVVSPVEDRHSG